MNFAKQLSNLSDSSFLQKHSLLCLKGGGEYPVLFSSLFIKKCRASAAILFECINGGVCNSAAIIAKLQTSFLGSRVIFWLGDISTWDTDKRKKVLAYLTDYKGPNLALLWVSDLVAHGFKVQDHAVIELPHEIGHADFRALYDFAYGEKAKSGTASVAALFQQVGTVTLEKACVLMYYLMLLGARAQEFFDTWLATIICPERSLFTLSRCFFAKDSDRFFSYWSRIASEYPDVFWTAYWSEQLWRAYNFIALSRDKRLAEAKQVSYRLPFSFMQREWRKSSEQELCNAHDYICSLDASLKNSESNLGLDLFYEKFFLGKFKQI